jgi:hypothetical protein
LYNFYKKIKKKKISNINVRNYPSNLLFSRTSSFKSILVGITKILIEKKKITLSKFSIHTQTYSLFFKTLFCVERCEKREIVKKKKKKEREKKKIFFSVNSSLFA